MPGWTVLFALLALLGLVTTLVELPSPAPASVVTSFVFSALFAISVLAQVIRRRV